MDKQDFEQLFRATDNKIYDFYRYCLYRMQEYPILFWVMLLLAGQGLFAIFIFLGWCLAQW